MSITEGPTEICVCGEGFHFPANLAAHEAACAKAAEVRAEARRMQPLKLMVSGIERHISEGLRVGCGSGSEYILAAHRMVTQLLKKIDEGK